MNEKEKQLLLHIIDGVQQVLSNRCCDDFEYPEHIGVSHGEKRQLLKEYHKLNGDAEEFEFYNDDHDSIQESCLLLLLADKLKNCSVSQGDS